MLEVDAVSSTCCWWRIRQDDGLDVVKKPFVQPTRQPNNSNIITTIRYIVMLDDHFSRLLVDCCCFVIILQEEKISSRRRVGGKAADFGEKVPCSRSGCDKSFDVLSSGKKAWISRRPKGWRLTSAWKALIRLDRKNQSKITEELRRRARSYSLKL
jgi:hypothetical protein